jgi:sphinganine-1-phosphate aldolase
MTRGPHLQILKQVDAGDATHGSPGEEEHGEPSLTSVTGIAPDDGRLAHVATRRREVATPSLHEAEARLLGFVADLLDAPDTAAGRVVPGVQDAALLALRGARDARPSLRHGTVVLPSSAHPAYFTAVATLGLMPVVVPVDHDGRAPLGATAAAVRDDTVLVVASAPSYTHGTIDPIGWLAAAAAAKQVPLHVDATSGGWAAAYAERAGRVGTSWGFAVPGVTSVAIDVGPESGDAADLAVVLHRDSVGARAGSAATLARGPLTLPAAWTRPGALLADVVETLHEIGHEGCAALAREALEATAALVAGLPDHRGLHLAALPEGTVVTLRADSTCDVFTVADALHARGWTTHPVLPETGSPLLRLPVTAALLPVVDDLLADLADAVDEARRRGRAQVDATLERLLATIDPDEVHDYSAHLLLDAAAALDGADPDQAGRRSAVNLLLAAAEPGVREALLSVHLDRLVLPVRPGQDPATTDSTDASE